MRPARPADLVRRPPALRVCGMCRRLFGPTLRATDDHVIPFGFFEQPVPDNLPTWRVCKRCQRDLDPAEERVRNVFASAAYPREPGEIQGLLERSRRSKRRIKPHGRAWLRRPDSVILEHMPYAHPDPRDLSRVFTKIVGGLFYWKHGHLAPDVAGAVRVVMEPEFTQWSNVAAKMGLSPQHLGNVSWVSMSDPELHSGFWFFFINTALGVGVWAGEAAKRVDIPPSRPFAVRT